MFHQLFVCTHLMSAEKKGKINVYSGIVYDPTTWKIWDSTFFRKSMPFRGAILETEASPYEIVKSFQEHFEIQHTYTEQDGSAAYFWGGRKANHALLEDILQNPGRYLMHSDAALLQK